MNIQQAFSIKGIGKYLPDNIVSSKQIEKELNLPENWVSKYIGVESRHIATTETNTSMAVHALQNALEDANLDISEIDCLIAAAGTFDYVIPNRSSLIKNAFKAANKMHFSCVDINTVCSSFITALDYASLLFTTGKYKNIAIVSSEISSKGINPNEPETYSLFGDGAAAVILSHTENEAGLIHYDSKTYSEGAKYTIIEGGGNAKHPKDNAYDAELYSFKMHGKKLLKSAMEKLPNFINSFFDNITIPAAAVDMVVPHQASKMGIRMLESLKLFNKENIINHLVNHGNCISASIPLALVSSIKDGKLKQGDNCFLIGTAAGMSISGLLFKYAQL